MKFSELSFIRSFATRFAMLHNKIIEDLKKSDDVEKHLERVREQKVIDERQIKQSERQRLKKELGHEYVSSDSENENKQKMSKQQISVDNFGEEAISQLSSVVSQKENGLDQQTGAGKTKKKQETKQEDTLKVRYTRKETDMPLPDKLVGTYEPIKKLLEYLEIHYQKSKAV